MISRCYALMLFIYFFAMYFPTIKGVAPTDNVFDTKFAWDHLDELIRKPEKIPKYVHCFYYQEDCTFEELRFKRIISEALSTDCKYCSTIQKNFFKNLMRYIRETYASDILNRMSGDGFSETDSRKTNNMDSEIRIHLGTNPNMPYMDYLKSQKLVIAYLKCFLDEAKCSNEGSMIKNMLPSILTTNCSKCSKVQQLFYNKAIVYLEKNYPIEYMRVLNKYVPNRRKSVNEPTNLQCSEFTSENITIKIMMSSKRVTISVLKCLLDMNPCSALGNKVKNYVEESLNSNCSQYSPQHEEVINSLIKYIQETFPKLFNKLLTKYALGGEIITQKEIEDYLKCRVDDDKCVPGSSVELVPNIILLKCSKGRPQMKKFCEIILKYFKISKAVEKTQYVKSTYENIYENLTYVDPYEMMSNKILVESFLQCIFSNKSCSSAEIELKNAIPQALTAECRECTPQQINTITEILQILQEQYPDAYFKLYEIYDPYRKIGGAIIRDSWSEFYAKIIREEINLTSFLNNRSLIHSYTNCFLDKSKCTPEGLKLKNIIIDVLTTECSSCLQSQRDFYHQVLMFLRKQYPSKYNRLSHKYRTTFL